MTPERRLKNTQAVRILIVVAAVLSLLVTWAGPHHHDGPLGKNGCAACLCGTAEEATSVTPDVAPRALVETTLTSLRFECPPPGFPLGAVPGQSPPAA